MKTRRSFPWALRAGLFLSLAAGFVASTQAQPNTDPNHPLPVVILRVADAEASEPGHNEGLFEVFRDGPTNEVLLVWLGVGGTASNGVDYAAIPNWILVPAGVRSVPIPVKPMDDALVEGAEEVALELFYPPTMSPLPPNYVIGAPSNGVVRIFDNDPPPTNELPVVTVEATDPEAAEPGLLTVVQSGEFTVRRTGPTNQALPVFCQILGTASNSLDYAAISNVIVIPAGAAAAKVMVYPVRDELPEGPEVVVLNLLQPPCPAIWPPPPTCYTVGAPGAAVVRLLDSDPPTPDALPIVTVQATDPEAAEPGVLTVIEAGEFTLTRSGSTNHDLPVFIHVSGTASNGVDYRAISNVVVIPAGRLSARVIVHPLHDLLPEGTETVVLHLPPMACPEIWPPPPGCYQVGTPAEAVVRIRDNDEWPQPVVTIVATDPEGSEIPVVPPGMGMPQRVDPAVFVVSRTGNTNLPLPVFYTVSGTASNGVDYVRLPGTLTIPAGATAAPIEVLPIDDFLVEGTETVVVRLEPPICIAIWPPPPECYVVGTPSEAAAHILDNDLPPTNHPPEVKLTRPREGETFVLPAKVALRADALDADGYVPHLEFYAGERKIGEETRMFFVAPPPGQHHVYEMVWTNPPAGRHVLRAKAQDDDGASGWSAPVTIWVVVTNEPPVTDPPPVVTITAPDAIASEGTNCLRWAGWSAAPGLGVSVTNTALFVIRRTGPTNHALTVHYHLGGTASNGVDYVALPGTATIAAGRRTTEIRLVPIDDVLPERLETTVLGLRVPPDTASSVPPYLVGYPGRAAAVIVDNDQPRPATGVLPDRCFHFMRPGTNGAWFRIEWSGDMLNWTPLCTNAVVDGALHFVDPDADDAPQRFYRAVPETAPAAE